MTNDQAIALIRKLDIRCVIFDIDGVISDDNIVVDSNGGELFKTFNVKDGLVVQMLAKAGTELGVFTGSSSSIVVSRAQTFCIRHAYQGKLKKTAALEGLQEKLGIIDKQVACIGDDVPDMSLLRCARFSACPADAHKSAVSVAVWQSAFSGGRCAVRDCRSSFECQGENQCLTPLKCFHMLTPFCVTRPTPFSRPTNGSTNLLSKLST